MHTQVIAGLRKEVSTLQEEVKARNAVVGEKEARIYELTIKVVLKLGQRESGWDCGGWHVVHKMNLREKKVLHPWLSCSRLVICGKIKGGIDASTPMSRPPFVKQVQELEKHRFVLEFRATELKEALEPQQQANTQLQEDTRVRRVMCLSYVHISSCTRHVCGCFCTCADAYTYTGPGLDQRPATAQDAGAQGGHSQWPGQAPDAAARA